MHKLLAGLVLAILLQFNSLHAQKRWNGSIDSNWNNALNWQPSGQPDINDAVILDNSIEHNSYRVILPDSIIYVHSLLIGPSPGGRIELMLPFTNTASPAIFVNDTGNAIVINSGGILKNSSGLNNGQSILIRGLLRINNGGCYIHNTRASHATEIVAKLSKLPGTEKGTFEFDVPGGAYSLSMSNRTYGLLILSSQASGGSQIYNASGSNPLTINDDFQLNKGVQFNADFSGDIIVNGDFIQEAGTFNLASQPNNNSIRIKGNLEQALNAVITETSTGLPVIELNGNNTQLVMVQGSFVNQVTFRINNADGVLLGHTLLVPYKLEFRIGKIKTSNACQLVFADNAQVTGASVKAFVEGPVTKLGDDDFEFPVGKQGDYAPVRINGAPGAVTGEYTVEYFLANPLSQFGAAFEIPVICRVSSLEYWLITRTGVSSLRKLTLPVSTYSNATAIEKLVVARWDSSASTWRSEGNSAYSGIAIGTLTSYELFASGAFTLASTIEYMNPLTVMDLCFSATRVNDDILFSWNTAMEMPSRYFEIEESVDGRNFRTLRRVDAGSGFAKYSFRIRDQLEGRKVFYRLKISGNDATYFYSEIVILPGIKEQVEITSIVPAIVKNEARLIVRSVENEYVLLTILDINGRIVKKMKTKLIPGNNLVNINLGELSFGMYLIRVQGKMHSSSILRFIKE